MFVRFFGAAAALALSAPLAGHAAPFRYHAPPEAAGHEHLLVQFNQPGVYVIPHAPARRSHRYPYSSHSAPGHSYGGSNAINRALQGAAAAAAAAAAIEAQRQAEARAAAEQRARAANARKRKIEKEQAEARAAGEYERQRADAAARAREKFEREKADLARQQKEAADKVEADRLLVEEAKQKADERRKKRQIADILSQIGEADLVTQTAPVPVVSVPPTLQRPGPTEPPPAEPVQVGTVDKDLWEATVLGKTDKIDREISDIVDANAARKNPGKELNSADLPMTGEPKGLSDINSEPKDRKDAMTALDRGQKVISQTGTAAELMGNSGLKDALSRPNTTLKSLVQGEKMIAAAQDGNVALATVAGVKLVAAHAKALVGVDAAASVAESAIKSKQAYDKGNYTDAVGYGFSTTARVAAGVAGGLAGGPKGADKAVSLTSAVEAIGGDIASVNLERSYRDRAADQRSQKIQDNAAMARMEHQVQQNLSTIPAMKDMLQKNPQPVPDWHKDQRDHGSYGARPIWPAYR